MIFPFLKEKKNIRKGSALIQVLVLSGIFSFIFAAISNLIVVNQSAIQELQSRSNVNELHSQIYVHLLNGDACLATFTDAGNPSNKDSANDQAIPAIKNSSGTNAFITGFSFLNVRVENMIVSKNNYGVNVFPGSMNSSFDVIIKYSYSTSPRARKETYRSFKIMTASGSPWLDGTPLVVAAQKCITFGSFTQAGVFTNLITKYATDEKTDGNLFIGTGGSPADLIVKGGLTMISGLTLSDKNVKENLAPKSVDLDQLNKVKSYSYNLENSSDLDYGFLSQELEQIFPELVYKNPRNDHLLLNYQGLIPVLFESNKKLEAENLRLEAEISKLEKRVNENAN